MGVEKHIVGRQTCGVDVGVGGCSRGCLAATLRIGVGTGGSAAVGIRVGVRCGGWHGCLGLGDVARFEFRDEAVPRRLVDTKALVAPHTKRRLGFVVDPVNDMGIKLRSSGFETCFG